MTGGTTARAPWRRIDGPLWALLGVLLVAAGTRLVILLSGLSGFDADEAVTGVMAQRILNGDFPAYFGVQSYQGALEQYLQAPLLAIFPDTPTTLRLVQLALTLVITVLVYRLGTMVVGSRWAGVLAAALYAVGPYYSLLKGIKSHGAYDAATIFGLLAIILALRLRKDDRWSMWVAGGIGVATGAAIWENYTAVYLLIPALIWALGSARGNLLRLIPAGIAGLIIGALPAIGFRVVNGPFPPSGSGTPPALQFWERAELLLNPVLADFLGVRAGGAAIARWAPPAIVAMVALMILGAAAWTRRMGLWDMLTLRMTRRRPVDVVILAFLITPPIYAFAKFTWYAGEPRYLFTLYPLLAIGLAAGVFALTGRARMVMAIVLVAASALVLGRTMQQLLPAGLATASVSGQLVPSEDAPTLAADLKAKGVRSVFADYWVAYPLQFAGGDAFVVTPNGSSHFPAYDARSYADPDAVIVAPTGAMADATRAQLQATGRRFQTATVARYTIFSRIAPPLRTPQDVAAIVTR